MVRLSRRFGSPAGASLGKRRSSAGSPVARGGGGGVKGDLRLEPGERSAGAVGRRRRRVPGEQCRGVERTGGRGRPGRSTSSIHQEVLIFRDFPQCPPRVPTLQGVEWWSAVPYSHHDLI